MRLLEVLLILSSALVVPTLLSSLYELGLLGRFKRRVEKPIQEEVSDILKTLETNSKHAVEALMKLQIEVQSRTKGLQDIEKELTELQQQRSLLELTKDQKAAIATVLQRPKTIRDILLSNDFWVGRVLPGVVFFLLGTLFSSWFQSR